MGRILNVWIEGFASSDNQNTLDGATIIITISLLLGAATATLIGVWFIAALYLQNIGLTDRPIHNPRYILLVAGLSIFLLTAYFLVARRSFIHRTYKHRASSVRYDLPPYFIAMHRLDTNISLTVLSIEKRTVRAGSPKFPLCVRPTPCAHS